jgi:hypothetical protein
MVYNGKPHSFTIEKQPIAFYNKIEPIQNRFSERDFVAESVGEMALHAFKLFYVNIEAQIELLKKIDHLNDAASFEDVISGKIYAITLEISLFLDYLSRLPGFNTFSRKECLTLAKVNMFSLSVIKSYKLYFNDEYHVILPNGIHFSKYWIAKIMGQNVVQTLIHYILLIKSLNLTDQELSLTILLICAISGDLTLFFFVIKLVRKHKKTVLWFLRKKNNRLN